MTATAALTPATFLARFWATVSTSTQVTGKGVQGRARRLGSRDSPAETLQRFTARAASTTSPPGPRGSWVGETIVHAEDIRRPPVIAHTCAPAAVRRVADFYQGSTMAIGAKNRIEPVTLRASDTDRSRGGGLEVIGRLLAPVMAMTGRNVVLDDLEGPGVDVLRLRD